MAPNIITVDFSGAPPAQSSGGPVHIPQGQYPLRIKESQVTTTRQSKATMIVVGLEVAQGEHKGSRLTDRFVFPKSADDNKFGLQRFHAFLLAVGVQVKPQMKFDLDALAGRVVVADVIDNELDAFERDGRQYPARTVSAPAAYYSLAQAKEQAKQAQEGPTVQEPAPPTAAPQPAPEPELVAVAAAAPAQQSAGAAIEEAIEDLFK